MRLNEFLKISSKFDAIKNTLITRCSDILDIYKTTDKTYLYRGVKYSPSEIYAGQPPINRFPKNTPKRADEIINQAMQEVGYTARRDNSIFVTSDYSDAGSYGNLYIIFPFNGYKFTWSKLYRDLTTGLGFSTLDFNDAEADFDDESIESHHKTNVDQTSKLDNYYNKYGAKGFCRNVLYLENTDMRAAIMSKHEIYLHGNYIAVSKIYMSEINNFIRSLII